MIRTATLQAPTQAHVVLVGGILGLAEDGPQVQACLDAEPFDGVLLGIPFEDLDAIRTTAGKERTHEFSRDETDELYLQHLARFGPVQVPPADLYVAYAWAQVRGLLVEAIDLGDEGHTAAWTQHVGFFELVRNNRRLKRLPGETFAAADAESFAAEWDERIHPTKGLRRVQDERETWMSRRIAEFATAPRRLFALIPLARWAGVRRRLQAQGFEEIAPTGNR